MDVEAVVKPSGNLPRHKYRSRDEIEAEILQCTQKGAFRSHIKQHCSLNYSQLFTYITVLIEEGLLEERKINIGAKEHKNFITTEKGLRWLYLHQEMMTLK